MIHRLALAATLALAVAVTACSDAGTSEISVEDAFARETIGTGTTGAAYLLIRNTGNGSDRLTGAETPVAETAELHTHAMEDGVMKMRRVDAIDVPAGELVTLEPGGLHIMLFGLAGPLRDGGSFPLTLTFEEAGNVTVEVSVVSVGGTVGMDHGGMDHGDMNHGGN